MRTSAGFIVLFAFEQITRPCVRTVDPLAGKDSSQETHSPAGTRASQAKSTPSLFQAFRGRTASEEADLAHAWVLRRGKETHRRPPRNHGYALSLLFTIYHVLAVDESVQQLEVKVRTIYQWLDKRLAWTNTDMNDTRYVPLYGGVESEFPMSQNMFYGSDRIWTPHVMVAESVRESRPFAPSITQVHKTGQVSWVQYLIVRSFCEFHMDSFAHDTQYCRLSFTAEHRDTIVQKLAIPNDSDGSGTTWREQFLGERMWLFWNETDIVAEIDSYFSHLGGQANNKFELKAVSSHIRWNEPGPEPTAVVVITLKRRSTYYHFYILLPSLLTLAVALQQFWITAERAVIKIGLGLMCLTSVMLQVRNSAVDLPPDSHEAIAHLGRFLNVQLWIIGLSTAFSALVVATHGRAGRPERAHVRLRRFTLGMALLLRMTRDGRFLQNKSWTPQTVGGARPETDCAQTITRDIQEVDSETADRCQETAAKESTNQPMKSSLKTPDHVQNEPVEHDLKPDWQQCTQQIGDVSDDTMQFRIDSEWRAIARVLNTVLMCFAYCCTTINFATYAIIWKR